MSAEKFKLRHHGHTPHPVESVDLTIAGGCSLLAGLSLPYLLGRRRAAKLWPRLLRRCQCPPRPESEQTITDRAKETASTIDCGDSPRSVELTVAISG